MLYRKQFSSIARMQMLVSLLKMPHTFLTAKAHILTYAALLWHYALPSGIFKSSVMPV
jgi:hypothetical protein